MKLSPLSGKEVIKVLEKDGFIKVSQRGSHIKLHKQHYPVGRATIIVPAHKTLKKGTLAKILKQANINSFKLRRLLKA